ncbi:MULTISPECIES: HK97 gp10 family phage protein [Clostridium]|uniref:HK97 gp10 family phage protein n=1 Tax=Clostridium lapidicellarium TaxID=3240931 RepID=A0ABV4DWC1_9CLOT
MAETGFEGLEELDSFTKDMLELAEKEMPRESSKFLKKNANQLKTATKNKAKQLGIIEETGNYYEGFKSGKVYKYNGALSCRAYNTSPHAHLLEYGHLQTDKEGNSVGKGFVPGFHPFQRAYEDFINKYYNNCEQFVDDMINKHGL